MTCEAQRLWQSCAAFGRTVEKPFLYLSDFFTSTASHPHSSSKPEAPSLSFLIGVAVL